MNRVTGRESEDNLGNKGIQDNGIVNDRKFIFRYSFRKLKRSLLQEVISKIGKFIITVAAQ